ncbi:hypothetical protein Theco_3993 (plasmid) [Thermobacillus composti KWC4]|uniref:Uncharacterized protein n=1 Tax=Thermobacillus composti (strain DSM 18247 / JCM 13945 / KWC4) TaxID=717605 RepID=L0EKE4_THECK|nr:hypothetical protein Theco_3993 [Thermobacillus composti KWC4]
MFPVLEQLGMRPHKKHLWTRSVLEHTLEANYRENMSTREYAYFWIRWTNAHGVVDKGALERVLADWYFAMSRHFSVSIYWMQTALDIDEFRPLYGFEEKEQKIWVKVDKPHRFSFFPVLDFYHFEVRHVSGKLKAIQHNRFSLWLDELKYNLLGHERPDDQISFDMVV